MYSFANKILLLVNEMPMLLLILWSNAVVGRGRVRMYIQDAGDWVLL